MTDGTIKNTGNSRLLRSIPDIDTQYPTWADARAALRDGTFPIDLAGINPDGWERLGDKLSKETLLTDTLCAALGLPNTATPTQAMDRLRQKVNTAQAATTDKAKIETGSYTGTGLHGATNPNRLTFNFPPKLLFISGRRGSEASFCVLFVEITGFASGMNKSSGSLNYEYWIESVTLNPDNTVEWYGGSYQSQQNYLDVIYYYTAIG